MRYVALLRGINVGGNSLVKMSDLKKAFENLGFENVSTYINSGNVIFDSDDSLTKINEKIDRKLSKIFNFDLTTVVISKKSLEKTTENIPAEWKKSKDLRCYIAFVKEPISEQEVLSKIRLKDGVDSVATYRGVLYMTTKLSGITKSGFSKLARQKIYKHITIRNYNTVKKLLELS